MSDNKPMDPIPTLDFEEDDRPEPMTGAARESVRKPFPILKVVGGTLGGMVVITVVAYFGLRMTATPAPTNQFDSAIPQPAIAAVPQPAPVMVSPHGQGMTPQQTGAQQMAQPQLQPMPVPQPQPQLQLQPQMVSGQAGAAAATPATPAGMATPVGVVQQAGAMVPGPMMQAGAGALTTVTQTARSQQATGATDSSNAVVAAQNPNQPMAASTVATPSAGPTNQEVLDKLAQLTVQVQSLRAKLEDKSAAPQAQTHAVAAEKPKAADAGDAQASQSKVKAPAQKHVASAQRPKATGVQTKRDAATEDTGYVLSGMIGDRAFITKRGASDVNGGASVVAGDVLDDGRQVVMVDAKQKRVWLKGKRGAEFIGGEASGNE
ncbi:hypothetical protein [Pandoraea sp. ISTKB]|uniref:hypothetical protein n=1 Tax=Pandoraea sp. ISTKB TaxID=1586708 RepID=UPI0008695774|nr:hypothetical protein [Pandoraea sp. ISTKB]ODP35059.1 hypothetical protein A9762_11900 [Pandoraea sp. ISTKB]